MLATFLVLYVRRSPLAWVVIPIPGVFWLVQAPILYAFSMSSYPARVRASTLCFGLVLGTIALTYGFLVRREYARYLDYRRRT